MNQQKKPKKKLVTIRRISQMVFCALFVYSLWSTTYPLTGYIHPAVFFKADPLAMLFTAIAQRVVLPGLIFSLIILGLTLIFGRFFCGWICPLGTMIDAVCRIRQFKITNFKFQIKKADRIGKKTKFVLLGCVVFAAIIGVQIAWVLDPITIAARFISMNFIPAVTAGIGGVFVFLIKTCKLYGPVYDVYRGLKESLLGVHIPWFSHAWVICMLWCAAVFSALFARRFWCRYVCPLGALYAFVGRFALLKRAVKGCVSCGVCSSACRMAAIDANNPAQYNAGECIMCMDCVYSGPCTTRFSFAQQGVAAASTERRKFLLLAAGLPLVYGFSKALKAPRRVLVIRPPASLPEAEFVDRCIRCGNCMKVCPTTGLQPCLWESGIEGIWTPRLVPEIGWCEYNCTLCGSVCPTQAITPVTQKEKSITRLGLAVVDRSICLPWQGISQCLVCEEHCPVADKAIKIQRDTIAGTEFRRPIVDSSLCVGCGICQNKCPLRPRRAITVTPVGR